MAKHIAEIQYPDGFSESVTSFIGSEFAKSKADLLLPSIKNNHEAYGIMAEKVMTVTGSASFVNASVKDALTSLPNSAEGFISACEMAYDGCLNVAKAAIDMAIAMQNIVDQRALYAYQTADKTPLENMAEEEGELLDPLEEDEE
jgi:hypothetical protein